MLMHFHGIRKALFIKAFEINIYTMKKKYIEQQHRWSLVDVQKRYQSQVVHIFEAMAGMSI